MTISPAIYIWTELVEPTCSYR